MSHERWKEIADRLPEGLRADWEGTNHYEMSSPQDPFWLRLDSLSDTELDWESEYGQRLGTMLDAAAEFKALQAEAERLRAKLDSAERRWKGAFSGKSGR